MCVCVCVCVYIYIYIDIHVSVCARMCVCVCVCSVQFSLDCYKTSLQSDTFVNDPAFSSRKHLSLFDLFFFFFIKLSAYDFINTKI